MPEKNKKKIEELKRQYRQLQKQINSGRSDDDFLKRLNKAAEDAVTSKIAIENTDYVPNDIKSKPGSNYCIGGVCYILNQAGEPIKYFSNSQLQDDSKIKKTGRYLENSEAGISPSDIIQFKRTDEKGAPYHSALVLDVSNKKDNKGFREIKVVSNSGVGPMGYKSYYLGPDNKVYFSPNNPQYAPTQLLKRENSENNKFNELVRQRDDLKKQLNELEPSFLNPKEEVRYTNQKPLDIFFNNSAFYGGDPSKVNLDVPDRRNTYTLGMGADNRPKEQIYIENSKLEEMMTKYSDPTYKSQFMKEKNITDQEYQALVSNMFGIYGAESKFNTDYWGKAIPEPQFISKVLGIGTVGPFQLGRNNFSKELKKKYTNNDLHDPMRASEATMEYLAENLTVLRKRANDVPADPTYTKNITPDNYLEYLPYVHAAPSWLRGDNYTKKKYKDITTGTHPYKQNVDFYKDKFQLISSDFPEVTIEAPKLFKNGGCIDCNNDTTMKKIKKYGNGGKVEPTSKGYQQSASKYQPLYGKDFGEDEVIAAMIKDGYDKNTAIKYARLMQNNGPLSGKVFNIPSSFYNSDESSQMYPGSYYAPKRVEDVPYTPPSLGAKRVGKDLRPFSDNPYMEAPVEIFQNGGRVAPRTPSAREREVTPVQPSRADSLFLLNNNKIIDNFLKSGKYSWVQPRIIDKNDWENEFRENLDFFNSLIYKDPDKSKDIDKYYKRKKGSFIGTSDWLLGGGDDLGLPFQYLHPKIAPQSAGDLYSSDSKKNPYVYSYKYDDLAITPWDMLSESQRKQRIKQYGTSGTPLDKKSSETPRSTATPKPSHPTTPYMNKIPMRGMPNTNVSAEPMSVLPRTTNGLPFPDSWISNSGGTGEEVDYIPEHLRLDPAKQGWRSKQRGTAPAKATINKYDFGGLIDYNDTGLRRANTLASIASTQSKQRSNYKNGLLNYIKDAGLYLADNTLNTVGLGNVINSDTYNTKFGSKTLNNASSISGEISKVVAPIALSAVGGPLAGSAYSAGRSFIEGNINPDQYKNGGQVMKEIINIEGGGKQKGSLSEMKGRGELNVDLLGNILQNYTSYNPHPTNGRDVSSDVAVDGNTAIIPKKKAADFLSSNKRERQREILSLISKQKARERKKGVPMAADGWVTADNSNWSTMDTSTGKMSTPGGGTDWGALATKYGPQALSLLSPLTKVGRGLFDKVENINSSDYMVSPNLKPSLISDTASQMMINDSTNAGLNSLRRMNAGPSATVNLAVNSMKQKWASRQEIQRANATSTMTTDQANKQIAANNAGMGLKIRDMNDMNKAAKRNMLMEGINDLSKQGNKMIYDESFFQTLPMMADNPQFNRWLEKNGYRKA